MSLRLPISSLRPSIPLMARPQPLARTFFSARSPVSASTSLDLLHRQRLSSNPVLGLLRREFSTSRANGVRSTYFPQGGRGGGGPWGSRPPPRWGWFQRLRMRIDSVEDMKLIYALIGLNVGVYLLWQYAKSSWTRFRDPKLYQFMQRNFILSEANIMAGRLWTLVTSSFSHSRGDHILINALGLYFIAPAALSVLGGSSFLGLYLAGGIASSLVSLAWHRMKNDRIVGSEGASGAIYTTLGFYGALFPHSKILMFFIIPMPVWLGIGGIFAWDLYGAIASPHGNTDSAGHVGGMAAGLIAAYRLRRGGFGGLRRMFRR
ncbi:hypothetical protein DB88DRAFT_488119 [Papiliotrema laurentii]|uniref:Peptidase S54 rhomboid domain-containing protein n=1 Tax=Papiliotrema laurentii TaxID=5418 RepID=A0AAD9FS35_PAPLA|nr:hypothetical protein DB88DRAFT_488119 [Papiliotrema laurentii]